MLKRVLIYMVIASFTLAGCGSKQSDGRYWPSATEWETSAPEEEGMDGKMLDDMFAHLESENAPLHGLVIVRNGRIVAERYGYGYKEDRVHNVYSVTKSVLSSLVGIAIQDQYIRSEDDRVLDYFPDAQVANRSESKKAMTIKQLLSMSSGITDWPEWTESDDVWSDWNASKDRVKFVLDKPVDLDKVGTFNYNSGEPHVLSAILHSKTGKTTAEYAKEKIFDPIGMTSVHWREDINGITEGGAGIFMTPRDMTKYGLLILHEGEWNGKQIVPAEWVKQATSPQTYTGIIGGEHYGYYFWLTEMHGYDVYEALGSDGQFIAVIPELNLVAALTSAGVGIDPLLLDYIIPSVQKE